MQENYIEWNGQRIPLYDQKEAFRRADEWWVQNKERLIAEHPGKHLTFNGSTLAYVIADNHDDGWKQHTEKLGKGSLLHCPIFDVDIPTGT